jgi:glycosyltransferase involved in cell wall biosynthesis
LGSNRGVLVPPEDPAALADAITGVLSEQLPVDHAEARAYAQRFTPSRVAKAYAREYAGLLGMEEPRAAKESAA